MATLSPSSYFSNESNVSSVSVISNERTCSVDEHKDSPDDNKRTTLFLKIAEGKNFPVKDTLTRSSDPYCVIKVDGEAVVRTMTIYRNLDPFWGEEYTLHVRRNFYALSVYVYDEDHLSCDDSIGKLTITKREMIDDYQAGKEKWFPLVKVTKDSEVMGEVRLEYGISETKFDVKIAEARDLAAKDKTGSSDPYGILTLGSNSFHTEVRKQTRFPKWNAVTTLPIPAISKECVVHLELWDRDLLGKDEFMGQITIPLYTLQKKKKYNTWFLLKPRETTNEDMTNGSLRIKLRYVEASILPSEVYQPLVNLLINEVDNYNIGTAPVGITPLTLLEEAMTDRMEMAYMLVRIFLGKGKVEDFLYLLFANEINRVDTEPETLFRDNSLASNCMDQFMKITGTIYLQSVMGKNVKRIYTDNMYCELDESRISSKYSVRGRYYLHGMLCSILQSVSACPYGIRKVCNMVYSVVLTKYPEQHELACIAVSKFIFQRFAVPAVMNPKLFYLHNQHANIRVSRTLTLCAKALQQIGNLSNKISSPSKEKFMAPLAPFIKEQNSYIREFITNVVTLFGCSMTGTSTLNQDIFAPTTVIHSGWADKFVCPLGSYKNFPIFTKRFFALSYAALSYGTSESQGQSVSSNKLVAICNIKAVERVDKYVFGSKHVLQIMIDKGNRPDCAIYMKFKTVNELTEWMSSLKKTISSNTNTVSFYHPGMYKRNKWSCCLSRSITEKGCSKTRRAVVLGDWRDPLNPAAETETIFSQLSNAKECLRDKYLKPAGSSTRKSSRSLKYSRSKSATSIGGRIHSSRHSIYRRSKKKAKLSRSKSLASGTLEEDIKAEDAEGGELGEEEEEVEEKATREAKPVALLLNALEKIEEAHSVSSRGAVEEARSLSSTSLRKHLKKAEAVQGPTLLGTSSAVPGPL